MCGMSGHRNGNKNVKINTILQIYNFFFYVSHKRLLGENN